MTRPIRIACISCLLASTANAETIDVAPGQSIADAAAQAAPGDVIVLAPGTYTEDLELSGTGSAGSPITLSAAGATLDGTITLSGDHWVIEDLKVQAPAGTDTIRVQGSFNRLVRLDLGGGTRDAIDGAGTGNQVVDSVIHDFDGGSSDAHCIVLNPGATDWLISGNRLYDCSGDGVQLYSDGPERSIHNTQIVQNEIYYTGAIGRMENAVDVKNADGLLIADNRMYGFSTNKTLVFQKGPANIEVRCNVMTDGFTGVEFRAEDGGTLEKIRFVRNLMAGFGSYGLKFDDVYEASVYNNTFVNVASDGLRIEGGGLHSGDIRNNLWVDSGSVEASQASADYNGFFGTPNGLGGAHDVDADPLLDPSHRLGSGSPMIDAGTDVGLPYAGSAPDIGFFETGAPDGCGAPSSGGSGGAAGAAGAAGSAGGGNAGTSSAGAASGDDGGCGCRAPRDRAARSSWLAAAAALILAGMRRRARPF